MIRERVAPYRRWFKAAALLIPLLLALWSGVAFVYAQQQGNEIVFATGSGIYTARTDGTSVQQINVPLVSVGAVAMTMAPNGVIVTTGQTASDYSNSEINLYSFNVDGSNFQQLTSLPAGTEPISVAITPDGRIVSYVTYAATTPEGEYFLWACQINQCLTASLPTEIGQSGGGGSPFDGQGLSWSPNGQEIAVPADCYGTSSCPTDPNTGLPVDSSVIMLMPPVANGASQATQITFQTQGSATDAFSDAFPAFSPDGTQIAFVRIEFNELSFGQVYSSTIYVMSLDPGPMQKVISIPNLVVRDLSWSPDGRSLMFSEVTGFDTSSLQTLGVWSVNLNGSGLTRLNLPSSTANAVSFTGTGASSVNTSTSSSESTSLAIERNNSSNEPSTITTTHTPASVSIPSFHILSAKQVGSIFDTSCVTSKSTAPSGSIITSNANATYSCGNDGRIGVATNWIVYQNATFAQTGYNKTLAVYASNATQFAINGNSAFYNLLEYNGTKVANMVSIEGNELMIADYAPYNATTGFPSMSKMSQLILASLNGQVTETGTGLTNAPDFVYLAGEIAGVVAVALLVILAAVRGLKRG